MTRPAIRQRPVIVIGAGVAGLAAAAHLARRGFQVTVLEKNNNAGGRCDRIEREGYTFDTGPTLLVMPHLYEAEFKYLGLSVHEELNLLRVDPTYHLFFDDGSTLALTSDLQNLGEQLDDFENGASTRLLAYLAQGRQNYELGIEHIVQRSFRRATDFFSLSNIPLLFKVKALTRHYPAMRAYFDDPRLKAAFTFQDMYMGLSPFEAPTTFSLMQYSELAHGVWYPRGGMFRIVETLLHRAKEAGAKILLNAPVERIDVVDERAMGVVLENGERIKAEIVLANADLPYVYDQLLPDDGYHSRLDRKNYSCSTISFFWGLDQEIPGLEPHMLFLADDYEGGFDALKSGELPRLPSLYVHCPTRLDPALAPAGCDSLVAIVPVSHLGIRPEEDWQAVRNWAREAVFDRLASRGITTVKEHIQFETCFTPCSWRKRYNLYKGATHGLSHTLTQLAYMRPHNRHRRIKNLYFAGASTHPGTGVPTVLVSGRLAAERIADEWGTR